jgi:outer membrane protein insertion porin family
MQKISSYILLFLLLVIGHQSTLAQTVINGNEDLIDYSNPKEYELGGVTVSGVQYLDESVLITLTGLSVGDKYKIPGEKLSTAIENLCLSIPYLSTLSASV